VREIYRKLASELHPDRESDADERARKTALMQRINAAYEANNLLDLLNLQMEVAQLSEHMLSAIPAERLKNYIKVMQEQLKTLKKESKEILDRFAASFNLAHFERPKTIAEALQIFSEEVNEINQTTAEVEYDCRAIVDINQRDRCIDRLS
jgi:archaellum component FlaC